MFLENLKTILKKKKIKQSDLAKKVGISKASFTQWEKGSTPKFDTVIKIAEELNISLNYLAYGEEKENISKIEKLYNKASEADKQIINLILEKYEDTEKSSNTKIG